MFRIFILSGVSLVALANPFAEVFEGRGDCRFCWMFETDEKRAVPQKLPEKKETKPAERSRRILLFSAEWCRPCQALKTRFPWMRRGGWSIGDDNTNHVQIVDVDDSPETFKKWRGSTIPLAVLIDDGKEVNRVDNELTAETLIRLFNTGR